LRLSRQEEFEEVAMVHSKSLLRTASRLCRERPEAEDLVQETLLRAWRSFEQYQPGTNCKAWLFRIMLNLAAKRSQQERRIPALNSLEELPEWNKMPAAPAVSSFGESNVHAALEAMPDEHRVVLLLAVVEGFTCKEMGKILEIPVGTVMSRLSRARVGLRQRLLELERARYAPPIRAAAPGGGGMIQ